ncbi:hypothetical protein [Streptomyces sioyaensis]|uniref:hypothetical protein n=1 Tax=Streptomyces sioyaensis TaxID=67364 RepID=UPI0036EC06A8
MADTNPTQPKTQAPPKAGSRPSVRIDDDLAADLAEIMSAGGTFADAVRQSVGQLAQMYRTARAHGLCPPGTTPILLAYQLGRPTPNPPATSRYDASDKSAPRPVGHPLPQAPAGPHLRPHYADEMFGRRTPQAPPARPDADRPARA